MSTNDRIWVLMARALSKEATPDELDELEQLLPLYPEEQEQYRLLTRLWTVKEEGGDHASNSREKVERIFDKAKVILAAEQDENNHPIRKSFRNVFNKWSYAAVIALGFLLYYFGNPYAIVSVKEKAATVVLTKPADKRELLLPDGTRVTMNAGSRLSYDPGFSGKTREVFLEGEAFFDVAEMKDRPFIVHAGAVNIKVLGTAFNVKCYKDDRKIEATLIRGKIELSGNDKRNNRTVVMHANQKMEVAAPRLADTTISTAEMRIVNIDQRVRAEERIETSWLYDRLEFRGEDFVSLAASLERRYGINVHFVDQNVKELKFNGSFGKESVEQAFSALKKVALFNYKIKGNEVYIKSSEQAAAGIAD